MFRKRSDGSLTVEASIVLPLFICVILTIGFFIKIVHTHEIIQYAINETANDMASSSYLYYSTGLYELETTFYEELNNRKVKVQEQKDKIKEIPQAFEENTQTFGDDIKKLSNSIENGNGQEIVNSVSGIIETTNKSKDEVSQIYELIVLIKEDGLKENLKNLLAEGEIEVYHYLKTQIGNVIAKEQIKKHLSSYGEENLEERMKKLHIVTDRTKDNNGLSRLYGLDFSRSNYLYGNDEIDIVVTYKIDLPLPFDFIGEIPMIQRASARAWLGGTSPSINIQNHNVSKSNSENEEENNNKELIVFITRTGECYHKGYCYHLRKSKIPIGISKAEEKNYRPCSYCYGND